MPAHSFACRLAGETDMAARRRHPVGSSSRVIRSYGCGAGARQFNVHTRCRCGMDFAANGIFLFCLASLVAGGEWKGTRDGEPRNFPSPAPPEGGARQEGSIVQERFKPAGGGPT